MCDISVCCFSCLFFGYLLLLCVCWRTLSLFPNRRLVRNEELIGSFLCLHGKVCFVLVFIPLQDLGSRKGTCDFTLYMMRLPRRLLAPNCATASSKGSCLPDHMIRRTFGSLWECESFNPWGVLPLLGVARLFSRRLMALTEPQWVPRPAGSFWRPT